MTGHALEVGETSRPRFEFRSFGQRFDAVHHRMARLSMPVPEPVWERQSDEVYIVSRASDRAGVKIRHGAMDIKVLARVVDGLEQWRPVLKTAFPLTAETLRDEVWPLLEVPVPALPAPTCSLEAFLELVRRAPALQPVRVHKQRFGYLVHDTICEYAVVLINGARVVTVSTESPDLEAVRRTIADTGMTGLENISYVQALRRVLGMVPKPLANE